MSRIDKTVFISYRREDYPWALAIFQDLNDHGYDVFIDYVGVNSGAFETVIVQNIRARAHFLVLLTPLALKDCARPQDWLRREVEEAMATRRNVVPLTFEGFDFGAPGIAEQLTGGLSRLREYNAMGVPAEYFAAAMEKLRTRFLNVPLDAVIHPPSEEAAEAAAHQHAKASAASPVLEQDLTAQEYYARGLQASDPALKQHYFTEALRLNPELAGAYCHRGVTRHRQGDSEGALQDIEMARSLDADCPDPLMARAEVLAARGDAIGAMHDYVEVLRLRSDHEYARVLLAKMLSDNQIKQSE